MNSIIAEELQLIAKRIRELVPGGHSVSLAFRNYAGQRIELQVHGVATYEDAREVMRALGVKKWNKTPWDDTPNGRTVLSAETSAMEINIFAGSLPPTCRIEKTVERIAKRETRDTGEFIEIERTKVVCGQEA